MHSSSTVQMFRFVAKTIPVAYVVLAIGVTRSRDACKFIACSLLCVTVNHNKATQTIGTRSLAYEI